VKSGPTTYGYGWNILDYKGHRVIEHGGGINGFRTYTLRMPEDRVFVAILSNRETSEPALDQLALQIAALVINEPYQDPPVVKLDPKAIDAFVGVYQIDEKRQMFITRDGDRIFYQRTGGEKQEVFPSSPTEFFFKNSLTRIRFKTAADGKVVEASIHGRYGPPRVARKTDKPLPRKKRAVQVDPSLYDRYAGEYELAPGFSIVVTREGDRLLMQPTGQDKAEVYPESPTKFFLKEVDAEIEFVMDESGKVTKLILYQGGEKVPARKIR